MTKEDEILDSDLTSKQNVSEKELFRMNRRTFVKIVGATAGALAFGRFGFRMAAAAQSPQIPLAGSAIPQFVDPLPALDAIVAGTSQIELQMTEFLAQVLPTGLPKTSVWGYLQTGQTTRASYLGPVIVATRGTPTEMKFVNNLGSTATTNVLAYRYSTDQTLHWADPLNNEANMWNHMVMPPAFGSEGAANYNGPIPGCVHLHGGEVPPVLDGGPDAWVTSNGTYKGHAFYSKDGAAATNYHIYRYPNKQEGAPIWFHDHTLGATRLNVYAGLAGGYLINDPPNDPTNLPPLVPLVIQDRMFDTNGQLFFPADSAGGVLWTLNPEHPYWVPEFVGDTIVVNGKVWPFKNVEPKRYTFLFLNGSNARTYEMLLVDPVSKNFGPPMWVIGTDGGYLDTPVKIDPLAAANNKLVIMSGERYTVIIDFAGYQAGVIGPNGLAYSGKWVIKNTGKTPYPAGKAPQGTTIGIIMQFVVGTLTLPDLSFNPATPGAIVRPSPMVRLVNPATGKVAIDVTVNKTRQLTLNEEMGMPQTVTDPVTGALLTAYPGGPLEILVNNTKWEGKRITGVTNGMYDMVQIPGFTGITTGGKTTYYSELPAEGETEVWEIVNLTRDAHPIHLHLVQFQLMNRQNFDKTKYNADYAAAFSGGGYDPMTMAPYPAGVYIPAYGPPKDYNPATNPLSGGKYGGNPDINTLVKGKPMYLQGAVQPPLPQEAGWKDTVLALPNQVTRFVVRWAPTDLPNNTPVANATFSFDPNGGHGYVWHCHIIDHEDNEMMRPTSVVKNPTAPRTYIQGTDY
jgi:FtsP/CotA-like multicopper oxidase with cupredoxin domain